MKGSKSAHKIIDVMGYFSTSAKVHVPTRCQGSALNLDDERKSAAEEALIEKMEQGSRGDIAEYLMDHLRVT